MNYGVAAVIDIMLVGASSASSWSAAVDHDLKASTTPMCRTTTGITATTSTEGVRLSIPLATRTTTFKTATECKTDGCLAFLGIYGYDGDGNVSFYAQIPVVCFFTVDAEASGTVEPVSVTYLTQAQVEAIAASKVDAKFAALTVTATEGETADATYDPETNRIAFGLKTGPQGAAGPQGPQGPKGETGAAGPQGPQGDNGATGPANTLSIGTVTGGATASATITGDAPNQTLNLVLPKGDKGDTGHQGPQGPQVETGANAPRDSKEAK